MRLCMRLFIFALTVLLALFSVIPFFETVSAQDGLTVHNLNTGNSYATIQEAVNDISTLDGHIIRVDAGVYYEHVALSKAVSLVGEDCLSTIIDGQGNGTVIEASASNVVISGFTIRNSGPVSGTTGIHAYQSASSNVSGNIINTNWNGVWLQSCNNSTVSGNSFTGNQNAVYADSSDDSLISRNNFSANNFAVWISGARRLDFQSNNMSGNDYAIWITQSVNVSLDDNLIVNNLDGVAAYNDSNILRLSGNTISSNRSYAILLNGCSDSSVVGNNVSSKEKEAVYFQGSHGNNVTGNLVSSNGFDGIYLYESNGNVIDGNVVTTSRNAISIYSSIADVVSGNDLFGNDQGIEISNSKNIRVEENNVSGNVNGGIRIAVSSDNTVFNNMLSFNDDYGLDLSASTSSTVSSNNVWNNKAGIRVGESSDNNMIQDNIIIKNDVGLVVNMSNSNMVYNNTLTGNTDGAEFQRSRNNTLKLNVVSSNTGASIRLSDSDSNFFFHNNFSNNSLAPVCVNSSNRWDDGIEGNFWGIESLVDDDRNGIADSPFVLGDGDRDDFPLMARYSQFTATMDDQQYIVGIICNSSVSNLRYFRDPQNSTSIISFRVGAFEGLSFCRIAVHRALIQPPFDVTVDDAPPLYMKVVDSNGTHSWLYFSFPYIGGNVRIANAASAPPFWTEIWFWGIVVLAVVVGVLALAVYRFYRRLGSYRKTIEEVERRLREREYSPLEVARRLFSSDVERRSVKIGEFEDKYGIKIRPRQSLDEIFRSLKLREQEEERKRHEVNS